MRVRSRAARGSPYRWGLFYVGSQPSMDEAVLCAVAAETRTVVMAKYRDGSKMKAEEMLRRSSKLPSAGSGRKHHPRGVQFGAPARSCVPFGAADRRKVSSDTIESMRTSNALASRGNILRTSTRRTESPRSRVSHRSSSENRKSERNLEKVALLPTFSRCTFHGPTGGSRTPHTLPATGPHNVETQRHKDAERPPRTMLVRTDPATRSHRSPRRAHRPREARPGGDAAHTAPERPIQVGTPHTPPPKSTRIHVEVRSTWNNRLGFHVKHHYDRDDALRI